MSASWSETEIFAGGGAIFSLPALHFLDLRSSSGSINGLLKDDAGEGLLPYLASELGARLLRYECGMMLLVDCNADIALVTYHFEFLRARNLLAAPIVKFN